MGPLLSGIGAGLLGLVFVRAVLHKLGGYTEYQASLSQYRVLPAAVVPVVAPLVIGLEALSAAAIAWPGTRAAGAMLAAALLAVYGAAIAINLARGRTSIDCGCGGSGQGISPLHVLRNALLVAIALGTAAGSTLASATATTAGLGAAVIVAACVLLLWVALLAFDQLLGNRMHALATTYSALH